MSMLVFSPVGLYLNAASNASISLCVHSRLLGPKFDVPLMSAGGAVAVPFPSI
jgi:hypothetical protein